MRNQVLGGRYRILERIGEGGMAYVYVALDEKLGRKVAIKVLHEHMEKNEDIRKRFQLEAQAVSNLDHPNIVKIYDFSGTSTGRLWIVTEVIHGKNLAQFVQKFTGGWLHPVIAACIVREICKALEKAHSQGIVHRDIKPENIMLTNQGQVKLMDFGIAKDLGKTGMTLTGTFMGSPSYMSPEQIRGRGIDHRSDIYSLSVLFYEIVTGRLPFTGQTTHEVVLRIMEGEFTYPRFIVPDLPERLDHMIVKGMAMEVENRYQSARQYGQKLDQWLSSIGFDESHVELERFFRDQKGYEERLAKARFGIAESEPRRHTLRSSPRLSAALTRRETEPPREPTRPPAPTLAEPPPFRAPDTWQRHLSRATGITGIRQERSRALPPPPPPPREPTPMPEPPARHTTALLHETPVAEPRPARRPYQRARISAGRQVRRLPTGFGARGSLASYVAGFVLVGLIGGISIWGFWEMHRRLDRVQTDKIHVVEGGKKRPEGKKAQAKKSQKRPKKKTVRRKSPSAPQKVVKALPESKPATPRPVAPEPKRVARTTPEKATRPEPETRPVKPRAKIVVGPTILEKAADPALEVETAEIKQTVVEPEVTTPREPEEVKPEVEPTPKEEPRASGQGRVTLSSQPAAEIFIDGRRYGTTVDATTTSGWIDLKSGRHVLELRRTGYALHRQVFHLEPGQSLTLPRIVLERNDALDRAYRLTLIANPVPVQVTIRNIDENTTTAFTMKTPTQTVDLGNGRYQVRVERDGQVRERFIVLTAAQSSLTFSADFQD